MSEFVLNRNYELQLPTRFVDVDRDEMEYVDGGGTYSGWKGWGAAAAMVSIGSGAACLLGGMAVLVAPFGPIAWLISAATFSAPAYLAGALANAGAQATWYMATKGQFTIQTNNNPFSPFTVS